MRTQLEQFRQQLYERVPSRADALVDLVDALSSNTTARSVVELSLSPLFRQGYGSLYSAIQHFSVADPQQAALGQREAQEQGLRRLIGPYLPPPEKRPFWLLGLDVTCLTPGRPRLPVPLPGRLLIARSSISPTRSKATGR